MKTGRWWIGVTAGVALGLGSVIAVEAATTDATAQSGFTLSAEQLRINQRISQAAVRRSNEGLDLLNPIRKSGPKDDAPGWATAQIRDGAVTSAKLDSSVREGLPRWAVVTATTGALSRGDGVTAAAKLPAPGDYSVTFDRDVTACAIQATLADTATTPVDAGTVTAWRSATDPKTVIVRTFSAGDVTASPATNPAPVNTLPFHVTVLC